MALANRFPQVRRISFVLLVLGAFGLYWGLVEPNRIKEHSVTFHLDGPVEDVTRIDAEWTSTDPQRSEVAAGTALFFARGTAPRRVSTTVRLPSGAFLVNVVVSRGSVQAATRSTVDLDGSAVVFVSVADEMR